MALMAVWIIFACRKCVPRREVSPRGDTDRAISHDEFSPDCAAALDMLYAIRSHLPRPKAFRGMTVNESRLEARLRERSGKTARNSEQKARGHVTGKFSRGIPGELHTGCLSVTNVTSKSA